MKKTKLHIEIQKADGMQGFAAYEVSPATAKKKVVLLNVYSTLACAIEEGLDAKEMMITHLMHEFGHILEEFFEKEFDEDFMERVTTSYIEKYSKQPYESIHGDQTLDTGVVAKETLNK